MVDPPVCVPRAIGAWKSLTAAPEPAEEPPGVRVGSCGLRVAGPMWMAANSVVVVLPVNAGCGKYVGIQSGWNNYQG